MDDQLLEILARLVDFVEMASPKLWEIALRQVYVEMAKEAILTVSLFVAASAGVFIGRWSAKRHKESPHEDYGFMSVFMYGVAMGLGIFAIVSLVDTVQYLINPEYHAVKLLLDLMP